MRFFAFHGCLESERKNGNHFTVDFNYEYDMAPAAEQDCLELAVDYSKIYDVIREEMMVPSNLIENVAWRILESVKRNFPEIYTASVTVSKDNPPIGGECESSSVTMEYRKTLLAFTERHSTQEQRT